ncbi:MAG: leucyl aminopeptidase [Candidatus Kerfeldbacteria bacterium]|nr:leucyl aminopeptidase [Candidatus Kerfeldbacteria bacterium]
MSFTISSLPEKTKPRADAFILALFSGETPERHPFSAQLSPSSKRQLRRYSKTAFTGAKDEVDFVVFASGTPPAAFLVGLGKRSDWTRRRQHLFFRRVVALARSQKMTSVAVHLPSVGLDGEPDADTVRAAAENLWLAEYRYQPYKRKPDERRKLATVDLAVQNESAVRTALATAKTVAKYANCCRDLANTPGGDMTPSLLASKAKEIVAKLPITFRALDKRAIEKECMGAILGVARGSSEDPRFLIMEYRGGKRTDAPVVFVGKGVTFDSGGINLKPAEGLKEMHMDMSGGAAVVCAVAAIAERKLPLNVIGLVPAVENMPSGSGYRPGDILKSRSGQTIEIGNTDAEGRVILADALDYALHYKPRLIVDLATLTGAAVVALGFHYNALFASDDRLGRMLQASGDRAGDPVWPLPLGEEYAAEVKGTIGDVSNVGKHRYGGASHGAVFLQQFVKKTPWAHVDLAMMTSTDGQHLAPGASGTGVRLLVAFAEDLIRSDSARHA